MCVLSFQYHDPRNRCALHNSNRDARDISVDDVKAGVLSSKVGVRIRHHEHTVLAGYQALCAKPPKRITHYKLRCELVLIADNSLQGEPDVRNRFAFLTINDASTC